MSVIIGGRCSESIFLDDITTGASDDLEKLRNLAKAYICVYGFSDKLGNLNMMNDDVSEKMKQLVDNEIQNLIDNVSKYTNNILTENKEEVKKLVTILLKKEEINKNDIKLLLGKKLESSIKKFS
jgi:ATP-dependent Zn protease